MLAKVFTFVVSMICFFWTAYELGAVGAFSKSFWDTWPSFADEFRAMFYLACSINGVAAGLIIGLMFHP